MAECPSESCKLPASLTEGDVRAWLSLFLTEFRILKDILDLFHPLHSEHHNVWRQSHGQMLSLDLVLKRKPLRARGGREGEEI